MVARSLGRGGEKDEAQEIFRAVKLFCVILSWWIHYIMHLSKTTELYKAE